MGSYCLRTTAFQLLSIEGIRYIRQAALAVLIAAFRLSDTPQLSVASRTPAFPANLGRWQIREKERKRGQIYFPPDSASEAVG